MRLLAGRLDHPLLQRDPALAVLAEAGRVDHRHLDAVAAALIEDRRDPIGGRGDQRQVDMLVELARSR
jgi:hypothetical protein